MKIGFSKICINPERPCQTSGFAIPKADARYTKLDLWARALRLTDGDTDVLLLSLDSLDVSYEAAMRLQDAVRQALGAPQLHLLVCCTHTHQAPALTSLFGMHPVNEAYLALVEKRVCALARGCTAEEGDWKLGYACAPFLGVGAPRISGKGEENVYAGVLSVWKGDQRYASMLFYNCHPTVDREDTGYFSSEWVGWAVDMMERRFPGERFLYLQGSDGDVSTRFVRREKTFAEVTRLGDLAADCFAELRAQAAPACKASASYAEKLLTVAVQVKPFPALSADFIASLPPKEARELQTGRAFLERLAALRLPQSEPAPMERLTLGDYRLLFNPFELFSDYNALIDKKRELLVGYTNGACSYLTAPGNTTISYEMFMETASEEDKRAVAETIKTL